MDRNNGITKDTSARKNTNQHGMHSGLEMAAVKAGHEAYVQTMITGHEQELETLRAEHEVETTELTAVHDVERRQWDEKHRTVATEAARRALESLTSAVEISELKDKIAKLQEQAFEHVVELKAQLSKLKSQDTPLVHELKACVNGLQQEKIGLEKSLALVIADEDAAVKAAIQTLNADIKRQSLTIKNHQASIMSIQAAHGKEVAALKRQLAAERTAWVEICSTSTERNNKIFAYRPDTIFSHAARHLAKDINVTQWSLIFKHNGVVIGRQETKTFKELGIKSGDQIAYENLAG